VCRGDSAAECRYSSRVEDRSAVHMGCQIIYVSVPPGLPAPLPPLKNNKIHKNNDNDNKNDNDNNNNNNININSSSSSSSSSSKQNKQTRGGLYDTSLRGALRAAFEVRTWVSLCWGSLSPLPLPLSLYQQGVQARPAYFAARQGSCAPFKDPFERSAVELLDPARGLGLLLGPGFCWRPLRTLWPHSWTAWSDGISAWCTASRNSSVSCMQDPFTTSSLVSDFRVSDYRTFVLLSKCRVGEVFPTTFTFVNALLVQQFASPVATMSQSVCIVLAPRTASGLHGLRLSQ
jgi:hypothetical protein